MVAGITSPPVIGVPVEAGTLWGIYPLMPIVQMPKGVPVATVAINNARNAGLLALRMMALSSPPLLKKLADFMAEQENVVIEKAGVMEREGWRRLLDSKG
jgi:phosphoribosylaminoimidazole carboxylase PurE protein